MPRKKVNQQLLEMSKKDYKKNIKKDDADVVDAYEKYLESFIYKDMDYDTKHMIRSATVNPDGTLVNYLGQYIMVRKRKGVRRSRRPQLPTPPEELLDKYYGDEEEDDDTLYDFDDEDEEEEVVEQPEPASFNSTNSVDKLKSEMTTNIDSIESVLMKYKDDKDAIDETYRSRQRKEYKSEPLFKPVDKKQKKKERKALLENVFNNVNDSEEDSEDAENRLDTTYGKRFAPVVEYIFDTINEFDNIADSIQNELANNKTNTKGMYYTSQIGNLISARNSKLSAIKELTNISKTISDIEYKREKDSKKDDEGDMTKTFVYMGAQYLRGSLNNDMDDDVNPKVSSKDEDDDDDRTSYRDYKKSKKKKKDKYKKGKKKKDKKMKRRDYDDDDDDDMSVEYVKNEGHPDMKKKNHVSSKMIDRNDDVFDAIMSSRKDIKLNPYEQFIEVEGTYKFVVVADADNPDKDWSFVAVDPDTDEKIKGFKDKYKALYPDKKLCKMYFNFERMRAIDKATNKSYQLIIK